MNDWAEKEAREFDVAIGTTLKCKCGTTDLAYHCRLCFQDALAALLRRVREDSLKPWEALDNDLNCQLYNGVGYTAHIESKCPACRVHALIGAIRKGER